MMGYSHQPLSQEDRMNTCRTPSKMLSPVQTVQRTVQSMMCDKCTESNQIRNTFHDAIYPRTRAKDLVKMLEKTGTKVSISTVKRVLYRHNLQGHSARKKPLLQNRHKKSQTTVCNCTWGQRLYFLDETK
uniref:Transposase Tc1-like domain-containing protein n=1 Tax=Oncorhynchus tshawytscha TaxID=74940 RepID=A0AAZ3QKI0_ONCTS